MKTILFIFGTRPEGIKCAPVIKEFQKYPDKYNVLICNTQQHKTLLTEVLDFFQIKADYELDIMQENQTLPNLTSRLLPAITNVLQQVKPNLVFVQGDTTTAFIGALASFYEKIPVAHIEAGLRSDDIYQPFPEELNRRFISNIAVFNFTPTEQATQNLLGYQVTTHDQIFEVGNTIVDALHLAMQRIDNQKYQEKYKGLGKYILVTTHRRENFDKLDLITNTIKKLSESYPIVYVVHPNPNVKNFVSKELQESNITIMDAVSYPEFLWLMQNCLLIISDSGGVQEEAPTFKKSVVVLRNVTERQESVKAGYSVLAGTDPSKIMGGVMYYLTKQINFQENPYGDGFASQKIVKIIGAYL